MAVIARLNQNKRRGRRRLRTVQTLPTLLTLGNMVCGIAAIHFCMSAVIDPGRGPMFLRGGLAGSELLESFFPTYLAISGLMVFAGMFLDMMDGRIARATHRTSNFGGQLDSLADMVTFGVAPAVLMITLLTRIPETDLFGLPPRAVWVVGAVYACCTALRLARFNVEHADQAPRHTSFRGLPSPAAASVVASLVILHQMLLTRAWPGHVLLANLLPYVMLGCSALMVSSISYAHVANRYLTRRRPFWQIGLYIVILALFLWQPLPVLAGAVCLYAVSGPAVALARWIGGTRRAHRGSADLGQQANSPSDSAPAAQKGASQNQ